MHVNNIRNILFPGVFFCIAFHAGAQPVFNPEDSIKARQFYSNAVDLGLNNEPEKALELFQQSLNLRIKIYGSSHVRLAGPYVGIAIQYKNLHQLDSAYRYYQIAEQIYLKNIPEDDIRLAVIYVNLGSYFKLKGNITEATRYNERAVNLYENSPEEKNGENHMTALYNLALCYFAVDKEDEALRLSLKFQNRGSLASQIRFKSLIASIYTYYKQFDKANSCHKEIINSIISEYGPDDMKVGDEYFYYAEFLNKASQQDSAYIYLKKAESVYNKYRNNQSEMGYVYKATADAFAEKNISSSTISGFQAEKTANLNNAIKYYRKSLDIFNPVLMNSRLDFHAIKDGPFPVPSLSILRDLGTSNLQLSNLFDTGDKETKVTYLTRAIESLSTGSDLIKYLRTGFISEESKLQFNELQQSIFNLAIETAYELYRLTGETHWAEVAFINSERNKATSLFDKIIENQSRQSGLIPDSLMQLEGSYNNTLAFYREQLFDESQKTDIDSAIVSDLKDRIFNYEQKQSKLREYLEKNFHDYYQMKYETKPLTFVETQKRLKRREVLLSYSLIPPGMANQGTLYVLAISKSGFRFLKHAFNPYYTDKVKTIQTILSDPGFLTINNQQFSGYCKSAYDLYLVLISPLFGFIRDKRITVVPDGILNYVPFEALLTRNVPTSAIHFNDLPYFILDNTINYAYSAELLGNVPRKPLFRRNRAAAFSPEYPGISVVGNDTIRLSRIPGIFDEVNYLRHTISTTSYSGNKATERIFRHEAGNYRILHLAMHTLINDSVPMFSKLAFFPEQPDSVENDGWLTLSDIYNLRLQAGMTVLSACHSGTGVLRKGEGIMSLARGFLYAGCPSVIMTLWEVEDRTGTAIMKDFYRNLKFGKRKDTALQNAKIRYITNADPVHSHPHIWLSYIVIGNPEPLFFRNLSYLISVMALILAALSFKLIYRKKPRK